METFTKITRKELMSIPNDYRMTMKKHLNFLAKYKGVEETQTEIKKLTNLGYDVEKDYYILKSGCLMPVHVIKGQKGE